MAPQPVPPSLDRRVIGERFVPQHEGAMPPWGRGCRSGGHIGLNDHWLLVGLVFEVVSLAGEVIMVAVTRARVCLAGGTSNPVKDLSETLGLFLRVQGAGGGVCWEACCGVDWPPASWVPGNQCPRFMLHLWTMSSSGSTMAGSSTRMCSALPWKTESAVPSRAGTKEPSLTNWGPLCRASPILRPLGRIWPNECWYKIVGGCRLSKQAPDLDS